MDKMVELVLWALQMIYRDVEDDWYDIHVKGWMEQETVRRTIEYLSNLGYDADEVAEIIKELKEDSEIQVG